MDTHAAIRMLTAAGADEALAVAVADVAQSAAADHGKELATRADLQHQREVRISLKWCIERIWPSSKPA